jgi:type I restriction enzyme S subunit
MSLEPYGHYKDSGISWMTRMPASWSVRRVKTLFEIRKRIVGEEGPDVLSVTQQGIRIKDIASNDGQLAMDYSKYQIVEPGDFVMNHMDLLTGWIDIATTSGVTSPDYRVFATRSPGLIHDAYFLYVFQNAYKQRIFYALGQGASHFGRWRLPRESFNDFASPFPPKEEQVIIADFLDRETAKINDLIERKHALVRGLEIKKAELILLYVLQGAQPARSRKYSGSPWLGQIPDHWKTTRLKYATSLIVDCPHETPEYSPDGEFPVIRTAEVGLGTIDLRRAYRLVENEYLNRVRRAKVLPGDIVYGREGERWGFAACAPEVPTLCLGQRMMQFRSARHFDPRFLMWHLNARCVYEQGAVDTVGATSPHVNVETIRNYQLVEPPLDEQRMIADLIDGEASKSDELIRVVDSGIERLYEYRSSLISAAVTGQIDVRTYRPQEAAALCQ